MIPYYPAPLPETAANQMYRAAAQVSLKNNLAEGFPALARALEREKPKAGRVLPHSWRCVHEQLTTCESGERL